MRIRSKAQVLDVQGRRNEEIKRHNLAKVGMQILYNKGIDSEPNKRVQKMEDWLKNTSIET